MTMIFTKRLAQLGIVLVILCFGTYATQQAYEIAAGFQKEQANLARRQAEWTRLQKRFEAIIALFGGDAGVVIKDLQTGFKFTYQDSKVFPSASLVKVAMMAACLQAAKDQHLGLQEQITLQRSDQVSGSGKLWTEKPGSQYRVAQLIEYMIAESDNTATNIMINRLGIDYYNNYFQNLGLRGTSLARKMMDFRSRRQGLENYTSPADMAWVLEQFYELKLIDAHSSELGLEFLKKQKLRDRIPFRLPSSVVVAHKTGLENFVCHDGGIVYTDQGNYLICVMTKTATVFDQGSKHLISELSWATYQYMTRKATIQSI